MFLEIKNGVVISCNTDRILEFISVKVASMEGLLMLEPGSISCAVCREEFINISCLEKHMRIHIGGNLISQKIITKQYPLEHDKYSNQGKEQQICKTCDK